MKLNKWQNLSLMGGIFIIFSTVVSNLLFFATPFSIASGFLGEVKISFYTIMLSVLLYIFLISGIFILIGVLIFYFDYYRLANFFIALGAIIGLFTIILFTIIDLIAMNFLKEYLTSLIGLLYCTSLLGFFGILITLYARIKLIAK